jgi:4-amino-4-deoxy-L-arabinose transferase-like glycosyltransferase
MKKLNQLAPWIATAILSFTFIVSLGSMSEDSAVRDEMPHIVAGYTYLKYADYRINPEHPPLIKQLAAIPLFFLHVKFPEDNPAWKDRVNDQWSLGDTFLYKSGNNADQMLFWGRLPIVFLMLLTGWIIFVWTKEIFKSPLAGLIALLLFALSPNIIAHGRFITTDMGVAAFSVFALYSWWKFLVKPSKIKFTIAVLLQTCLHLAKFSSPLFLPIIGLMTLGAAFFGGEKGESIKKRFWFYLGATVAATALAFILVGIWYQIFTREMPLAVQQQLVSESIFDNNFKNAGLATKLGRMTNFPILRPYVQYLLGFFMVAAHASYGHSTYFMGEVGQNWKEYYFITYLLKEPIASQILVYISFTVALISFFRFLFSSQKGKKVRAFLKNYFVLLAFVILISLFLYMGAIARLQLGIRYVVPIFPYLYMIAGGILGAWFTRLSKNHVTSIFGKGLAIVLFGWLFLANILTYPSYLSYFNESVGGNKNGWLYLVDSNVDWGQDLKRLKTYADQNGIKDLKIDYFGGGNLDYYFGQGNYTPWGFEKGPAKGWFAISASAIQWNSQNAEINKSYHWLTDHYEPKAKIGSSIFVYKIE